MSPEQPSADPPGSQSKEADALTIDVSAGIEPAENPASRLKGDSGSVEPSVPASNQASPAGEQAIAMHEEHAASSRRGIDLKSPSSTLPRRLRRSLILFGLTCLSTYWAGASGNDLLAVLTDPGDVLLSALANARQGLLYMGSVMAILLAHEMGHFLQAVRYRVPTSWPLFIPMPLTPLGTMGAVILLRGSQANRRELFDIGLTGPWAGLLLALPMALIGIRSAEVLPLGVDGMGGYFGDPLVFKLLAAWLRPEIDSSSQLVGHANPLVMASWVGMLVTGLNMLPIGQLDGGHAAYALLGSRSRWLARSMVALALAFIIYAQQYGWSVMLALVVFLGTSHPPTADDDAPLGRLRSAIGWCSLAIPIFCLTPFPFVPG